MKLRCTTGRTRSRCAPPRMEAPRVPLAGSGRAICEALLGSADLCSKRWIWEQYDYMVRTNTIAGPGGMPRSCASRKPDTSIAMSLDGNGRYCSLDPREGTKLIVAECCRNLSTVGALPVAATNNLNFGNPERPEIMAQLVEVDRRHGRSLRVLRDADHRRQRQPLQRDAGRGDLSYTGGGHRGPDEDRAAADDPF